MGAESERDLPEIKRSVAHAIEEAEEEPDTEEILKRPESLRY